MSEEIGTYILVGILLVMVLVLSILLYQYKRQIKSFIKATEKRRDMDINQPIMVDYFNKDITELAVVLNEYTDMTRRLSMEYQNDRKQLKNVIAGISHDFRTPLTAAAGYMQLLEKSGDLPEKDREYLDIAVKKIVYLKLLSDDFFEISSLEARDEELELSKINIGNFLSDCILQQYAWIEKQGLRTNFQLPEDDVFIETNEHYLGRIIENLFSNIRKYVKSYAEMRVVCEPERIIIIAENDLIDEDDIDIVRIFEPFYRGSARSNEGSGLGLYVVKCLADRLGYDIWADCDNHMFRLQLIIRRIIDS
ncbi:MAG: HAMP domain-containing histidine kinase [Lachnospiraceae bacterium]|nr:HAMP domain-containing histidine kinase [Lachnospiraceae bacterium]